MSKAEDILKKHTDVDDGLISTYDYIILAAMKEIAELSFDAGHNRGYWLRADAEAVDEKSIDKQTFVNNIFNNDKDK